MPSAKRDVLAVIDLNVFVSALLGSSVCRTIVSEVISGEIVPVISPLLLSDLAKVLKRPRFRKLITAAAAKEIIETIRERGLMIVPHQTFRVTRDPDDDHLLFLAVEGRADVIVSGDKDLTSLGSFFDIPIKSPRLFISWINSPR